MKYFTFISGFFCGKRTASAVHVLGNIGPGTWECYEHPGLNTPEMRTVWHIDDEDIAFSRDAVTKAFTSENQTSHKTEKYQINRQNAKNTIVIIPICRRIKQKDFIKGAWDPPSNFPTLMIEAAPELACCRIGLYNNLNTDCQRV